MNDNELKNILSDIQAPAYDENAKKRALNLAMAEFDAVQNEAVKKNKNNAQGFSFFSRLIGHTSQDERKQGMKKRTWIYGGLATTTVAIMVVGLMRPEFARLSSKPMMVEQDFNVAILSESKPKMDNAIGVSKNKERVSARPEAEAIAMVDRVADVVLAKPEKSTEEYKDVRLKKQVAASIPSAQRVKALVTKPALAPPAIVSEPVIIQTLSAEVKRNRVAGRDMAGNRHAPYSRNIVMGSTSLSKSKARVMSLESPAYTSPKIRQLSMPVPERVERYDAFQDSRGDKFQHVEENAIKLVSKDPVSTFSIDVDTASYSYVRKRLSIGQLPPKGAVRIEEMVNYFDYAWPMPATRKTPFKPTVAVTDSPWTAGNKLVHIGIKGYEMDAAETPRSNLVFLLDVSGSMSSANKLPLVKNALRMLLNNLKPDDTVGIVVYAGAAGTVLEPTPVKNKAKILAALSNLSAGGSTAGGQGIKLAYALAEANFDKTAVNRIMLATDGDFNVGMTSMDELQGLVERKRKSGVFLSILGFGRGNWNDQLTQTLAQNGNGVVAYIDTLSEARKVLVEEASSTLFTIAKDVKIQVEFNPSKVAEYRLVGYETRALKREDFNNDAVDAGDIGSGHTVTAIYEITPVGASGRKIDDSRYQVAKTIKSESDFKGEYGFLKIRYKLPESDTSTLITQAITTAQVDMNAVVKNEANWATAVATFSQLLRGSKFTGKVNYDTVIELAQKSKGKDEFGYRAEFISLVRLAKAVKGM